METSSERMTAEKDGVVGWMIFNNPARHNAVSKEMWRAMAGIVDRFGADPDVRVIILRGAGERAFSAGADISEFDKVRATPGQIAEYEALSDDATRRLEEVGKPTIAMIRGYCIGGGFDLALRCDLRIAAEDARFGVPAARLGLGYSFTDIERAVFHLGPSLAKEIFFTARQLSAAEAFARGVVNEVVPAAKLEGAVARCAAMIAANAPLTIAAVKTCVAEALKGAAERDLVRCQAMVDACFASEDYVEGRRAFIEKRPPRFRGG